MTTFRKMFKNKPNTATTSTLAIIFILNYFFGYCTPQQLYEGSVCDLKDGSLGICKSFVLCRWAIQGLNQRVISYRDVVRCSFEGANEIICCGDERPTPSDKPGVDTLPMGTGDDGIYFDSVTSSQRSVKTTSTRFPPFATITTTRLPSLAATTTTGLSRLTTAITRLPQLTTATTRLPRLPTTTTRLPLLTTATTRLPRLTTTTTRLPRLTTITTTRLPMLTTTTTRTTSARSVTTKSPTRPTVHPFWSDWAPTKDLNVEVFSTNSVTTESSNSSKLVLAPWLQDMLNVAIASNNNVSTAGDGFNNVDNEIIGNSNNDLPTSLSRVTTSTTPSSVNFSRPPPRLGQRRSEIACENYTTLSSAFLSFNILGGVPTALGEFPHMAALGFPSQEFGENEYDFNCGGSVISENFILTAAHCVTDRNLPTIVRTGKITLLTNDDGVEGVTSTIAEIIPHPNYRPSRRYDDIALIRVSSPIPFGDNVRPACLRSNMSDIDADVQLIVTGWGRTSVELAQRSNGLLKTNLTGVSLESCNASLLGYNANDRSLRNGVNLGQICAYDPQARQDSCEGDSGGPMQIYSPNGMSTIVGVTSFGISCGSALPSVYARVAFYLDWIESIVWPNR